MHDVFEQNLKDRIHYLEQVIAQKEAALLNVPEGRIRCRAKNGRPEYYWVTDPGNRSGRYLAPDQAQLAAALAQKTYDHNVLKAAKEEYRLIRNLKKHRDNHNLDKIYERYGTLRQKLVDPLLLPDDAFVRKWLEKEYSAPGFEEGAPEFYSKKGLRVRSKTEIFIADTLDYLIIPFRYEFPIQLDGYGKAYPDFWALNVRQRRVRAWEHFGMMDDPEYVSRTMKKIRAYQRNGYFPGDNLILTFETKDHPLSPRDIERIARHYLL